MNECKVAWNFPKINIKNRGTGKFGKPHHRGRYSRVEKTRVNRVTQKEII